MDSLHNRKESWSDAKAYDSYVGRWSKLISADFISWLQPQQNADWLEVGCGTGSLTSEIVARALPQRLLAVDTSEAYLAAARRCINSPRVEFSNVDLDKLECGKVDYITSGLVLNFLPDVEEKLGYMLRCLKPRGGISAFVWDYAGHYQPMRIFWDAAKELHGAASEFDAAIKYPLCTQPALTALFKGSNLTNIRFTEIERIATFRDFDDYWYPIASAQGSVTEFLSKLGENEKKDLKALIKRRLPIALNGTLKLVLNALAVAATYE